MRLTWIRINWLYFIVLKSIFDWIFFKKILGCLSVNDFALRNVEWQTGMLMIYASKRVISYNSPHIAGVLIDSAVFSGFSSIYIRWRKTFSFSIVWFL